MQVQLSEWYVSLILEIRNEDSDLSFYTVTASFLSTKSLCETRIADNTSISTSDIVVLTLTADILEPVCVAHSEDVTTLAATCAEDLLSIYSTLASEESVRTETFSFFELANHKEKYKKFPRIL
jgi:hypothetical protein